ncbi:hypothetical protein Patl1_16405 [Pistacia atlantica]|uniref:Uncharacterized protein n=1 Tax=Pistacia atlantica TaxID=434234 RepID=A0ACC1B7V3_9ROSI|nr:hypothetical protein Patl1_16405 [Pistacia atlantica]
MYLPNVWRAYMSNRVVQSNYGIIVKVLRILIRMKLFRMKLFRMKLLFALQSCYMPPKSLSKCVVQSNYSRLKGSRKFDLQVDVRM